MRDTVFILCRRKARGNSSHALARALAQEGVNVYRVTPNHVPNRAVERCCAVINHGCGTVPIWNSRLHSSVEWYNTPEVVRTSANKIRMTKSAEDLGIPTLISTYSKDEAERWLGDGHTVVSRSRVGGQQGAGIVLSPPDPLPQAPMYTQLFGKRNPDDEIREYRVYIVGNRAVDMIEKRRRGRDRLVRDGIDPDNIYTQNVRSYRNGWVFARNTMTADTEARAHIMQFSEQGANLIGLKYGGFDVIVRYEGAEKSLQSIRMVETSTAIGLAGDNTTSSTLAKAFATETYIWFTPRPHYRRTP